METHFASPERSTGDELNRQVRFASSNPVIDGIMSMVGGLIAVLNQNRQILAVNHQLLDILNVKNPKEILGLRPGEALGCRYSTMMEGGCGTSPYCVTCGAAIAIVSTLGTYGYAERSCSVTVDEEGRQLDLFFRVQANTIQMEHERFVLIFLHDITHQHQQAALERSFFHDIRNTIMALLNASEILTSTIPAEGLAMSDHIHKLSKRLADEVELQRHISQNGALDLEIQRKPVSVDQTLKELETTVLHHPTKGNSVLKIDDDAPGMSIITDLSLLTRVLSNMLINAFEAENDEQTVRLTAQTQGHNVIFSVWNRQPIPPSVGRRIFQRNFSTKAELGRGFGTYSMKLIGEQLLGGHIWFETSQQQGTKFLIELPAHSSLL